MSKNIKDYLHLYLGCEVLWEDESGNTGGTEILDGHLIESSKVLKIIIKPILRPLSDITKEEVADLMGVDGFIKRGNWSEPFFQCEYEDLSNDQRFKHLYITQMSPTQTVFLIKSRFDLFNLIPEELAIDKTKTNK
jgi:hypothetical protein